MKTDKLGTVCRATSLELFRMWHSGPPSEEELYPFVVVDVSERGYYKIVDRDKGNVYKIKTGEITFKREIE